MGHAFDNSEAKKLNIQIFETFYHAVLERPCELAEEFGTHEIYQGSPASKDEIQHDLLLVPMPTASTSQVLGFNKCFEPYTSNLYTRCVLAGEIQVVCPWLLREPVRRKRPALANL
ncbi:hypothetical protein CF326_g8207 [Tilletia indica]|nr:hypothetical protein CF326_g8207 [Tilletia indica]